MCCQMKGYSSLNFNAKKKKYSYIVHIDGNLYNKLRLQFSQNYVVFHSKSYCYVWMNFKQSERIVMRQSKSCGISLLWKTRKIAN